MPDPAAPAGAVTPRYDAVILGAGPGGYDCALEAAARGLSVALVHAGPLGGTCLNEGCIPTKFWLGGTEALDELEAQAGVKIASGDVCVDFAALAARTAALIEATRKAMAKRLADAKVTAYAARGRFAGPGVLELTGAGVPARIGYGQAVIATGARPAAPAFLRPDGDKILSSTEFLALTAMPARLLVVGAGFIGLELAQAAHRLGAAITLVDAMDRPAPAEDPEVSKLLAQILKRRKWDLRLGGRVSGLVSTPEGAVLTLDGGETLSADLALVAVGRGPVSDGLGLSTIGASTVGPGWIDTDDFLQAADRVYAIGDVNGRAMLAHAASHQARYVAARLGAQPDQCCTGPYESGPVPSILYGDPEVLRVGRLEAEAVAEAASSGETPVVTRAQLAANPMAQAHAATRGFVKVVWSRGRVIGVTAVGRDVSRLATAATILVAE
ncbi:MAG: NAD(P)/FAD-dependent oxidoreductase, partial [Desulfovibrionaceae bacterium]